MCLAGDGELCEVAVDGRDGLHSLLVQRPPLKTTTCVSPIEPAMLRRLSVESSRVRGSEVARALQARSPDPRDSSRRPVGPLYNLLI